MAGGKGTSRGGTRKKSDETARTSSSTYPLLSPAEVLRAIVAMSREVSADLQETELLDVLFRTLRELLPKRLIAIRRLDPKTLKVVDLLSEGDLVEGARDMPPTVQKGALDYPNLRRGLSASLDGFSDAPPIRLVDEHPLIFRGAISGFSVPLVAGGELTGVVHINYGALDGQSPATAGLPLRQDKGLVIPLANHVAVVAHTRRLLRETAYLQDYLEQLIDQANVLIIAVDLQGRVTVWNRAMNRLTGFARAEVVGRELLPWLTELGNQDVALVMQQVASSGESATREVRLPSAGGSVLRAAFDVVTIHGQGNRPAAIMAVGQDVTVLHSLQNQIIHAEKLATVGQIAAGVAHEINNPLTSVQVCADAVLRKAQLALGGKIPNAFEPADIERLKKIREGSDRIQRFARDLVSYARPSGTEIDEVSLNEVVEQGLSFCEHVLDEAQATLERDLHRELPPLRAIRDQILQVVINLVTNAANALGSQGGQIGIRTWPAGGATVRLSVSDTGVGIKDEDRPHIFDPFFSTKQPGRGTGLGLSVVRNIIYSHGGQITFNSELGHGTTFVVTLPLAQMVSRTEGEPPQ